MKQYKGKIIAAAVILCVLAAAYLTGGNYAGKGMVYRDNGPESTFAAAVTPDAAGTAETSEAEQADTAETGTAQDGTQQGGAVQDEATQDGEPQAGATQDGVIQSGTSRDGEPQSSPEKSGGVADSLNMAGGSEKSGTRDRLPGQDTSAGTSGRGVQGASGTPQSQQAQAQDGKNSSQGVSKGSVSYSQAKGMVLDPETGKDKYLTDPVPEGRPVPVEPEAAVIRDTAYTCTLSVRCDTILKNMKYLDKEKAELVPEDGVIFPAAKVTFYEGESVFNVLRREMKKNKIHMEFENTPMYNSAYIEGIHNLYEFDVGELSGWMYKVNGWFPNYGCSRYQLKDGDVVEWVYTCDLGRDVGGYYAAGGGE